MTLDPRVLGKLLTIQGFLDVMPEELEVLRFACRGLVGLPGIDEAIICANGKSVSAGADGHVDITSACDRNPCSEMPCRETGEDWLCIPLRTQRHLHGHLLVHLDDAATAEPYVTYYRNFGSFLAILLDNRRQMVLLATAKDEADAASRAKSSFLSAMSHELRTPMNAVLGYAQMMARGIGGQLSERHADYVNNILQAGGHLLSLINSVLDLARIEADKVPLAPAPHRLLALVEECLPLVTPLAEARGISVTVAPGPDPVARCDHTATLQVLTNLLSNAVKYNRQGGWVSVALSHGNEGAILVEVSDSGQGIPPERVGELFQPFSRLDVSVTSTEGTGIGLAVCRKLMELMGGRIGYRRGQPGGSVFWIELPPG